MLVVPNHWGDAPIVAGSGFATKLRAWADSGIDIFLHGFFHRADAVPAGIANRLRGRLMTAGEGEFLGLDAVEAARRIGEGRALLEDITGRAITGFIAPAWLYSDGAIDALQRCGIDIAENHQRIWSPRSGQVLARGPVVTWASRSRGRLVSSLMAAPIVRRLPMQVLRIGTHPPDVHHQAIVQSIDATLASAMRRRRPASYSELLRQAA